jgi:hypothetical protein
MGQVVPFIARVRDSGDWSAAERARLEDLAERLAAGGVHVEVIFGATDEGDPWCVVTDADGDVLIHVARIDGKFVVHSAIDDAVNESVDLHTALRERLVATEEAMTPRSATILPFDLTARQGQTFLALLAATAFFYETAAVGDTAEAGETMHALPPTDEAPPPEDAAPVQEREAAPGVALQPTDMATTAPLAAAAPSAAAPAEPDASGPPTPAAQALAASSGADSAAASAAPVEPAIRIQGTDGDDLLVGTAADEHIVGGEGDDTLRGGGGNDILEGGAGDDVLEVTGQVIAIGGTGADTFVIQTPTHAGGAETLLGVILDFSGADGDRIFNAAGEAVHFRPHPSGGSGGGTDKQTPPPTTPDNGFTTQLTPPKPADPGPHDPAPPTGGDFTTTVAPPLTRVDVDLDGDGVADGYLLLGFRGAPVDPPITGNVGGSLGAIDPLG